MPLKQEVKEDKKAEKIIDPGKDLTTREARKAERLKVFKPPSKKADKLAERDERLKVWRERYGLDIISK